MSRAPDSSGSNILAVSSLCVFGLVDFSIKPYFIFRYARYAIKSDYFNLMLNCAKIFLSYKLLETEINSISLFL